MNQKEEVKSGSNNCKRIYVCVQGHGLFCVLNHATGWCDVFLTEMKDS